MSMADSDVAIVGMACHLPGATDVRTYWQNLRGGVESIVRYTKDELIAAGESAIHIESPNYVPVAAPLPGMEEFDGDFFGFNPRESAILDPQHRHFLECSWEALEDAGLPPSTLDASVGVFAGCGMGSYFYFNLCRNPALVRSVGMFLLRHTGNDKDFLATRVSYLLNLRGPSVNVQTACSTSLVATHYACQSLLSGECDIALAGGVTIEIPHRRGYLYRDGEVLSPDGHCHAFDHRAAGTVFGSGAGVVVLRRLEDAVAQGDHIYAVIKGSAVNNDGASKVGYLAPSVDGQAAAMAEAFAVSDVDARTIDYVECHGTGTKMGDPIEVSALTQAFRQQTSDKSFCKLGSVKTNIGHLDTAAGAAGLIKAAMSLHHREIPPTLNFERPNPNIDFESSPFSVADRLMPWPSGEGPRRAAINSLGVGGTNAFVILEEAPPRAATRRAAERPYLFALSAKSTAALDGACDRLAAHIESHPGIDLADVEHTLWNGRTHMETRRVLSARDAEELVRTLRTRPSHSVYTHLASPQPGKLAFLFPGGGAAYPSMGHELLASDSTYRTWVERGLTAARERHGLELDPLLRAPAAHATELTQAMRCSTQQLPAVYIVAHAIFKALQARGIAPAFLLGHSIGENTAAAAAGVYSFDEGLDLVALRGKLLEAHAHGAMISVPKSPDWLQSRLPSGVSIAIVNSAELSVLSGTEAAIQEAEASLETDGVPTRRLHIDVAAHSALLDPGLEDFRRQLSRMTLSPPKTPIISNLTGRILSDAEATSADYWVRQLREAVRFDLCLETAFQNEADCYLEVGPGRILSSIVKQADGASAKTVALPTMRHPDEAVSDDTFLLSSIGRIWASGHATSDMTLVPPHEGRRIPLPSYAFQRQHFFIEPAASATSDAPSLRPIQRIESFDRWFSLPSWQPHHPSATSEPQAVSSGTWLVFGDNVGVAARTLEKMAISSERAILVTPGDAYRKISDNEFRIPPESGREAYQALVRDVHGMGHRIDRVLHTWLCTTTPRFRPGSSFFHQNIESGFYSLVFLAQALETEDAARPIHIDVVTSQAQPAREGDIVHPEKATVRGPVSVLPKDLHGVTARWVDIDLSFREAGARPSLLRRANSGPELREDTISALAQILTSHDDSGIYVVRDAQCLKEYLAPAPRDGQVPTRIRQRGTYLITGGLGGIGYALAEHLAHKYGANLILLGRSELPIPPDERAFAGRIDDDGSTISAMHQKIQRLEALGATVRYYAVDVADLDGIQKAIADSVRSFSGIDGAFHAAGVVQDQIVQLKSQTDIEDVFAPKVHGASVLTEALQSEGPDFIIYFSSTSTYLGPQGQVDYVAANAFLNALAAQTNATGCPAIAVNWGVWRDVGMADRMQRPSLERLEFTKTSHPLLQRAVASSDSESSHLYLAHLSEQEDWILSEHRLSNGQSLLPGTGFIDLLVGAAKDASGASSIEIQNLFFFAPAVPPRSGPLTLSLKLSVRDYGFDATIRTDHEGEAITHASAQVLLRAAPPAAQVHSQEIWKNCHTVQEERDEAYPSDQERHLQFGPRWRNLRSLGLSADTAIAELELAPAYAQEAAEHPMHPALLDIATGFAMRLISGYTPESSQLWVPVSYGRIRSYGPLPARIVSVVSGRPTNRADREFAHFDVRIARPDGEVFAEISDFAIRKLSASLALRPPDEGSKATDQADVSTARTGDQIFQQVLSRGITPEEGCRAMERILSGDAGPVVFVSPIDLENLRAHQLAALADDDQDETARFSRPALESEYKAPDTEVERTLVDYWQELLGVDQIGVDDSFFDLGGHSLIAVRLFSQIKKTYQTDFPISVLFEAPTIRQCARMIDEAVGTEMASGRIEAPSARTRYTHLVPMHAEDGHKATPFFLVAGMFGNVLNLRHLAHLVGSKRPFYGLQARGLYGDLAPHATFEEMAKDYLEEIKTVQAEGPYLLGGFSGGGITALEMAQQLRRSGEEVALLVMLDTFLPREPDELTARDRIRIHTQRLRREGPGYLRDWGERRVAWEIERARARLGLDSAQATEEGEFQNDAIEAAFRKALDRYQLSRYDGDIVLFRPRLDRAYRLGADRYLSEAGMFVYPDNGWGPYASSVEVIEVSGNHDSMVLEPNVRVLAARLQKCIRSATEGRREDGPSESRSRVTL